MSVKFIKATKSDFPFLAQTAEKIWHEVFDEIIGSAQVNYMLERFQSIPAFTRQTENEGYEYYLIVDESGNKGYIALCDDGSDRLFMSKLYLLSEVRRKGYGKSALDFATATAILRGKRAIFLTVNKQNARAIATYENSGFVRIDSVVTDIGNGFYMDDFVCEKALSGEEVFDTYSEKGEYLGVHTRTFCHSKNPDCYHKPVWIWIVNSKGEVLVQKRAKYKSFMPSKWDMPSAGHVGAGESSLSACVRETSEELGLNFPKSDFTFLREYLFPDFNEIGQVHLLKADFDIKDTRLQVEEVEEIKWLSLDEFIPLFYSDAFVPFPTPYKDWITSVLKKQW